MHLPLFHPVILKEISGTLANKHKVTHTLTFPTKLQALKQKLDCRATDHREFTCLGDPDGTLAYFFFGKG